MILREVQRRGQLFSCLASLFYNVGNLKYTEKCYICYVKLVEENYGIGSIEVSNCYFLLGVFYLENLYLKKSMACFKRASTVRLRHYGPEHTSVADCYFNIGIVMKLAGRAAEAKDWLLNALSIRLVQTGERNIHIAKVPIQS